MGKIIKRQQVVALLMDMGVIETFAERAADDARITWTQDAISACVHDVDTSTMRKPGSALWATYLQHGKLPPMPAKAAPTPQSSGICDVCHERLSVCHGVHGYVTRLACLVCAAPLAFCAGHTMEEWRAFDAPVPVVEVPADVARPPRRKARVKKQEDVAV